MGFEAVDAAVGCEGEGEESEDEGTGNCDARRLDGAAAQLFNDDGTEAGRDQRACQKHEKWKVENADADGLGVIESGIDALAECAAAGTAQEEKCSAGADEDCGGDGGDPFGFLAHDETLWLALRDMVDKGTLI